MTEGEVTRAQNKGEITAEAANVKEGCMLFSASLQEAEKLSSSAVTLYYFDPV